MKIISINIKYKNKSLFFLLNSSIFIYLLLYIKVFSKAMISHHYSLISDYELSDIVLSVIYLGHFKVLQKSDSCAALENLDVTRYPTAVSLETCFTFLYCNES